MAPTHTRASHGQGYDGRQAVCLRIIGVDTADNGISRCARHRIQGAVVDPLGGDGRRTRLVYGRRARFDNGDAGRDRRFDNVKPRANAAYRGWRSFRFGGRRLANEAVVGGFFAIMSALMMSGGGKLGPCKDAQRQCSNQPCPQLPEWPLQENHPQPDVI